jgi:hypothetical protein
MSHSQTKTRLSQRDLFQPGILKDRRKWRLRLALFQLRAETAKTCINAHL